MGVFLVSVFLKNIFKKIDSTRTPAYDKEIQKLLKLVLLNLHEFWLNQVVPIWIFDQPATNASKQLLLKSYVH